MRDQNVRYARHQFRKPSEIVRAVLILMLVAGGPLLVCELWLATRTAGDASGASISAADFTKLVVRLDKQKDRRSDWAYAALVAIVAVSVVKKAFDIPWIRPAYVLLGFAGALMLESIRAGDEYERHIATLVLAATVDDASFKLVNDFLRLQMMWLNAAAFSLLLFVGTFLTAVLSGNVKQEAKSHD